MPKKKTFQDLKYKFIRGLIGYEKYQRKFNYLKSAAEWTSRAIVSLDLADSEIRSVKQAEKLEAIGGAIAERLKFILNRDNIDCEPPAKEKYASSASALLAALYDLTQEAKFNNPDDDFPLIHSEVLRERCKEMCEESFTTPISSSASIFCCAWWRLNILESRNYIKKRMRSKEVVYQILPLGVEVAERLKDGLSAPEKPSHDALYTTDDGSDGVVMCVDHRELGGDHNKLLTLCNLLSREGIKFKTTTLPVGDYVWYHRRHKNEEKLPTLVERKRGDDLAESLKDGRFLRQKENMKQWKNSFGTRDVQLYYVIEGDISKYVVQCGHECVGKCGNPDLLKVTTTLSELENDSDFAVIYTCNVEESVQSLVNIHLELEARIASKEFVDEMSKGNVKHEVHPPEKHKRYLPDKHELYSPDKHELYSPDKQELYSPDKHELYSPDKHELYSPDEHGGGFYASFNETSNNSITEDSPDSSRRESSVFTRCERSEENARLGSVMKNSFIPCPKRLDKHDQDLDDPCLYKPIDSFNSLEEYRKSKEQQDGNHDCDYASSDLRSTDNPFLPISEFNPRISLHTDLDGTAIFKPDKDANLENDVSDTEHAELRTSFTTCERYKTEPFATKNDKLKRVSSLSSTSSTAKRKKTTVNFDNLAFIEEELKFSERQETEDCDWLYKSAFVVGEVGNSTCTSKSKHRHNDIDIDNLSPFQQNEIENQKIKDTNKQKCHGDTTKQFLFNGEMIDMGEEQPEVKTESDNLEDKTETSGKINQLSMLFPKRKVRELIQMLNSVDGSIQLAAERLLS
ncbi:uncharacterized protein LOC130644757 isoform X1 [Hydractinia symbiolongicarpus]|uniref:uncharacterized protein LOC130644757 isoform X1 n=1 Tax=Hydractinia symbiolongicarpus TaxID=13093 RepID=UPI002551B767|nr:uncharacterized protein LOC130644757 isoform X1 [Hydractinia symbiolongicarpus]